MNATLSDLFASLVEAAGTAREIQVTLRPGEISIVKKYSDGSKTHDSNKMSWVINPEGEASVDTYDEGINNLLDSYVRQWEERKSEEDIPW